MRTVYCFRVKDSEEEFEFGPHVFYGIGVELYKIRDLD